MDWQSFWSGVVFTLSLGLVTALAFGRIAKE